MDPTILADAYFHSFQLPDSGLDFASRLVATLHIRYGGQGHCLSRKLGLVFFLFLLFKGPAYMLISSRWATSRKLSRRKEVSFSKLYFIFWLCVMFNHYCHFSCFYTYLDQNYCIAKIKELDNWHKVFYSIIEHVLL